MTPDIERLHARLDAADMLGRVIAFPAQMEAAWKIGAEFEPRVQSLRAVTFARVVVCGMGGSAIGGDLARSFLGERMRVPVVTCRDYELPAHLARGALVIASSYSGNTGETLCAYDTARKHAAAMLAVTSGGELAQRCQRDQVPVCAIPGGMPPRSAIGYSLFPMLRALRAAGVADFEDREYAEALAVVRERCDAYAPSRRDNEAIAIARKLHRRAAFVYAGPGLLEGVARRWSCQINENAKALAHFAFFPELNHNEIVGWEVDDGRRSNAVVLSLEDRDDHPMTRRQVGVGLSLIGPLAAGVERLEAPDGGRLARMLCMQLLGDFTSVYLAYLNGVDPTPVHKIDTLKQQLSGPHTAGEGAVR